MVDTHRDLFLHGQQLFLPLQIQTHKPKAKRKHKSDLAQHGRDQRKGDVRDAHRRGRGGLRRGRGRTDGRSGRRGRLGVGHLEGADGGRR